MNLFSVDLISGQKRCEIYLASVEHILRYHFDLRDSAESACILQEHAAENQLRGGCSDINSCTQDFLFFHSFTSLICPRKP